MRDTRRTTVVGVFHDADKARDAIEGLKNAGFGANEIGILMRDRDRAEGLAHDTGTDVAAGAATGAVGGGILGGLAGWLVGIGAIVIPGVGPFIAAGALGTALAGAAIGAGVGAVAGALVGMGVPKEEAEWYEGEVRGGRTLVTVRADGRYDEARSILRRFGAYDVEDRDSGSMGRDYQTLGTSRGGYTTTSSGTPYSGGSTYGDWNTVSSRYRSRWQSRFGNQPGARWEDYEPSYRYGWEMHNHPEYRGRPWNEVEPEFRRDWQSKYSDKPWDRFVDAIRDAWENVTDRDDVSRPSTSFGEGERGFRGGSTGFGERERTIPLREEELDVERRTERKGEVRIGKDVEEKRVRTDVPYTKEEVHIERRPASGRPTDEPIRPDSETIRVPVHEEEIDVSKRTVTREELAVDKDKVQGEKRVEETLRREVPKVEKEGDVDEVHGENLTEEERRRRGLGLTDEERRRRERGPF